MVLYHKMKSMKLFRCNVNDLISHSTFVRTYSTRCGKNKKKSTKTLEKIIIIKEEKLILNSTLEQQYIYVVVQQLIIMEE